MPLVQAILYYIPTFILGIAMVSIALFLSIGGLLIIRAYIPTHKIKLHNDIAGFIFATVGVIYAVLLAFMVIVSWQSFDQSITDVTREASSISSMYRDSAALDPSFRTKLVAVLDDYVTAIVKEEWPLLAKGQKSQHVQVIQENLWKTFTQADPKGEVQKAFYAEMIAKLNNAGELRRERLIDSRTGIHPVLWFVLVAGGLLTILFPLFFGTENFVAQVLMTGILATLIALILMTVMVMDYPFTGDIKIPTETFTSSLTHLATVK